MQKHKRSILLVIGLLVAIAAVVFWMVIRSDPESAGRATQQAGTTAPPAFDKKLHSLDTPTSPWVIANKRRPLNPTDFAPQTAAPNVPLRLPGTNPEMQVSRQIIPAVEQLFAAAKADGLDLMLASGYRSYQQQVVVYNAEVNRYGQEAADRESARPGHSEHQTGLAVDVEPITRQCEIQACFGDLPEGKWVAANAHKFGFIIRYSKDNEAVTGYNYEPWHIRYVGPELAAELYQQGNPPLETFFNLGAAPGYR